VFPAASLSPRLLFGVGDDRPYREAEGYAPEARGIKAALPHVDLYGPANTLQSLAALPGLQPGGGHELLLRARQEQHPLALSLFRPHLLNGPIRPFVAKNIPSIRTRR
jgi:hypothetical protein